MAFVRERRLVHPAAGSALPNLLDPVVGRATAGAERTTGLPAATLGAWLRERVLPMLPTTFLPRPRDENTWNACVAAAVGRSFIVATQPDFHASYRVLMDELGRRVDPERGLLGRQPGIAHETSATFYYALALDSLVPA